MRFRGRRHFIADMSSPLLDGQTFLQDSGQHFAVMLEDMMGQMRVGAARSRSRLDRGCRTHCWGKGGIKKGGNGAPLANKAAFLYKNPFSLFTFQRFPESL